VLLKTATSFATTKKPKSKSGKTTWVMTHTKMIDTPQGAVRFSHMRDLPSKDWDRFQDASELIYT
jgi:hypothetical protein